MAFARAELFGPLGIGADHALEPKVRDWPPTQAELEAYEQRRWPGPETRRATTTAAGSKLPARDLAKLGYLYLNGGRWDRTQVVPADYVAASTRPQSDPPQDLGDYGYQWWVTNETGHDSPAPWASVVSSSRSSPTWTWSWSSPATRDQGAPTPRTWSGR